MGINEHYAALAALDKKFQKKKVNLGNFCVSYEGCREATDTERGIIDYWSAMTKKPLSWQAMFDSLAATLVSERFGFVGEGKCSRVFGNDDFVVKMLKPDGLLLDYNCYFQLHKFNTHVTGYSSIDAENDMFLLIRETFLEHVLFPTLISKDAKICIQDRLTIDMEKQRWYFEEKLNGKELEALGPVSNHAWSVKKNKAYVIDIW